MQMSLHKAELIPPALKMDENGEEEAKKGIKDEG